MSKIVKGLCELVGGIVILIFIIRAISDKTPDAKTAPEVVITPHALGEQFSVGYWVYRCNGDEWVPTIGSAFPDAAFVVIDITAQNNDKSSSTLPPLHLVDTKGRKYDASSKPMYEGKFFGPLEELNPGVSKRGYVAFDVPPNREYVLEVGGGFESGESALVALTPHTTWEAQSSAVPQPIQPTPQPITPVARPEPPSAPPVPQPAPAPPVEASKPTSGVLCNWPVEIPHNGEVKFRNLPSDRLKFTFDHDAWLPRIQREPDGTQTLIMRSIKPGVQTMCDIRWEVVQ